MNDETIEFTVAEDIPDGMRLDKLLARLFPEYSRSQLQRLVNAGKVLMEGQDCDNNQGVHPGQSYQIQFVAKDMFRVEPEDIPLDILYEDDDMLVINKKPGIVVHPSYGNWSGTLVNAVMAHCNTPEFLAMLDEEQRPGVVHRLDKDTSGAIIFAKNGETWEKFKVAFAEHLVHKTYLTLAWGTLEPAAGSIDLSIGRHPYNPEKQAVVKEGGREAHTLYKSIAVSHGISLVKVRILTGRTHQIRVHLSHFGHPVLGDSLYGGRRKTMPCPIHRQMLHAWRLEFTHPRTGKLLKIRAPLPVDFLDALEQLALPRPPSSCEQ